MARESLLEARQRIKAAEWVAENARLDDSYRVSLTAAANRADWFEKVLPDLDYELKGGTWDEPFWAWMGHPWFYALGLTISECEDALKGEAK